jgi:hypothetical protein
MNESRQENKQEELAIESNNDTLNYYPILKAKRGELKALRMLSIETKGFVVPIVELMDNCADNVKSYLSADWTFENNKVLLDPFILLSEDSDALATFRDIYNFLTSKGVNIVIVVRLDYSDEVLLGLANILNEDSEIAIRITKKYLTPSNFDKAYAHIEDVLGFDNKLATLILDYSYIEEDTVDTAISSADAFVRHLSLSHYLAVVLSSGSFVKDLSSIPADSIVNYTRYEWDLWNDITSDPKIAESLSYGDYATRHPIYDDTVQSFAGSSSIRYTTETNFVILRGRVPGNHPSGMGQYHDKCNLLVALPEYDGATFSEADGLINDCANRSINSGNPESWVKISTARHIEKLTSLLN